MNDDPNNLEALATKLRGKIFHELSRMDSSNELDESSLQDRLKSYTGFFKLLQNLEEMIKRIEHERDKKLDRGVDILEFRRQLEEQIARLVEQSDEAAVS